MSKKIIERTALNLAKEILTSNYLEENELAIKIKLFIQDSFYDMVKEFSNKEELAYIKLLEEQAKKRVGSKEYVAFGYKLAAAKQRKASANRLQNNLKREDEYSQLKDYLVENFGNDELEKFFDLQEENKQLVGSTKLR